VGAQIYKHATPNGVKPESQSSEGKNKQGTTRRKWIYTDTLMTN
jgi:hypothetical protein